MTLHAYDADGYVGDVATVFGWSEFGEWVDTLSVQEFPGLIHLWEHGWDQDLVQLRNQITAALKKHAPKKSGIVEICRGILECIPKADECIVISNGAGSELPAAKRLRKKRVKRHESSQRQRNLATRGFTATCIYAILHSTKLKKMRARGGTGVFTEGKKWIAGKNMLAAAKLKHEILPIVFGFAERTEKLRYWAKLASIKIHRTKSGKWTTAVRVKDVRKIPAPLPKKTQLKVSRTRKSLPTGHIRSYVIVETPSFLMKAGKESKSKVAE